MLSIGQFFKKIKNKHSREVFVRTVVGEVIQKHTQAHIPTESIVFSSDTIILQHISSAARSHIFIKKQAILKEIAERQDIKVISDIK